MKNNYYFLRHGQTIYQKEKIGINYPPDSPDELQITEEGKDMIKNSAGQLKDKKIDLIFTSSYLRTRQSAEIAAEILGIKDVNYDDRIVDIDLGEFKGRTVKESDKFFSGVRGFKNRPKGGESWGDVSKRVKDFLDDVEERYEGKNILVVSHADPIWLMLGHLRGVEKEGQLFEARKDRENSYPKLGQLIKP